MTTYDFDTIERRMGSDSIKWDYESLNGVLARRVGTADVLAPSALIPMWVADMDFRPASPIVRALTERMQGVLGYTRLPPAHYEAISDWVAGRHGWQLSLEWIMATIGTLPMMSLALQLLTEPADRVIVQPPLFYPIPRAVENNGRVAWRNSLIYQNGRYQMDFDDLEEKAARERCKMLILCSPHNP